MEALQEEYIQHLTAALDAASASFLAAHPDVSRDDSLQLASAWVERQRGAPHRPHVQKGKKIVRGYIDGCYDLTHSGHFNAIRQARALCDELYVGMHTNDEILLHKGPPLMSNEERRDVVKACKWVDKVEFGVPYVPTVALLDRLQCDFCIHGDDMALAADGTDAFAEVKAAGRMAIVKRTEGVSTTDLITRLLDMSPADETTPAAAAAASAVRASPPQPAAASSSFLSTTWRLNQFSNFRKPKQTDTVVYIAGSFDPFNLGHVQALEEARKLGSFVYVGLHDDDTVRSYSGKHAPITDLQERTLNVLSCRYADEVVIGAPLHITLDLVKTLNVSVVVLIDGHGNPEFPSIEHVAPEIKPLVQLHTVKSACGLRTSDVVSRIVEQRARYEQRNAKRSVKDAAYAASKEYVEEK